MDRSTVEALLRAYYLSEFLADCIVEDKYKPPLTFVGPLHLTNRGKSLANQIKGDGISLMEAQLAAFMVTWAGAELLIDPVESDLDAFRGNISAEIIRGKLRYPWIYGRGLYDAVADSASYGAPVLGHTDTVTLLEGQPKGVFQLGPYICGPYGLIESKTWRVIPPTTNVPATHCHEVNCRAIHGVQLGTGETGVSRARTAISKKLSRLPIKETKVFDEILDVQSEYMAEFSWADSSGLPFFLFECLKVDDIKNLLVHLLANSRSSLRGECEQADIRFTDPGKFAGSLTSEQLLQVILLADDAKIHEGINRMIWMGEIQIAPGEIRSPKIVTQGFGELDISIQASSLGARHKPPSGMVPVRLRQLIYSCFPGSENQVDERLRWPLRAYEGDTAAAKLTNALAAEEPVQLVQKLIVTDEVTYKAALGALGLPVDFFSNATDGEIADLVTWHLGFETLKRDTELTALFSHMTSLKKLIGGLSAAFMEASDVTRIREVSSSLFVALELTLKRSICFIAWFALRDHFAESYDLSYSKGEAKEFLIDWQSSRDPEFTADKFDKMPLGEILGLFGSVAKFMRQAIAKPDSYARDRSEWPRAARAPKNPSRFAFEHRLPLLDLDDAAAKAIIDLTAKVPSSLQSAGVLDVRNGFLHHRDEVPDISKIRTAIEAIDARLTELVGNGLYPIVYGLKASSADSTGRRRIELDSAIGPHVVLTRPCPLDLSGFPSSADPQVVIVRATLRDSGEPLRFDFRVDSDYTERWRNFPRRPRRNRSLNVGVTSDVD